LEVNHVLKSLSRRDYFSDLLKKIVEERLKLWAARTAPDFKKDKSHVGVSASSGTETGSR